MKHIFLYQQKWLYNNDASVVATGVQQLLILMHNVRPVQYFAARSPVPGLQLLHLLDLR